MAKTIKKTHKDQLMNVAIQKLNKDKIKHPHTQIIVHVKAKAISIFPLNTRTYDHPPVNFIKSHLNQPKASIE